MKTSPRYRIRFCSRIILVTIVYELMPDLNESVLGQDNGRLRVREDRELRREWDIKGISEMSTSLEKNEDMRENGRNTKA